MGAAVAAIVIVVQGQPGLDEFRTIYSLIAVTLCGAAFVAALHLLERPYLRLLGVLVLIGALLELGLFLLGIWKGVGFDGGGDSDYARLIPIALAWAIATIVVATLPLIVSDRRLFATLVPATGACALVGASLATVLVLQDNDDLAWTKTLAVLGILMVAGYLLLPLAERTLRMPWTSPSRTSAVSDTTRI